MQLERNIMQVEENFKTNKKKDLQRKGKAKYQEGRLNRRVERKLKKSSENKK